MAIVIFLYKIWGTEAHGGTRSQRAMQAKLESP